MSVLLPDGEYLLVRPGETLDAARSPVRSYTVPPATEVGPAPGRRRSMPDLTYHVALDPSLWPVRQGDLLRCPDGTELVVVAPPEPNLNGSVEGLTGPVSYVSCTARRRQAVQQPERETGYGAGGGG